MHKPFMVYDDSYIIETAPIDKPNDTITKSVSEISTTKTGVTAEKIETTTPVKKEVAKTIQTTTPKTTQTQQKTVSNNTKTTVQAKNTEKTPVKTTVQTKVETPKQTKTVNKAVQKTQITEIPKATKTSVNMPLPAAKTVSTAQNEPMSQEELISWNKWHSDIQNKIMKDVKLPSMREGTMIYFSFSVDKFGRITNIKTYANDPVYTPYVIQNLAPLIKSYQGTSILNFPSNSKRFTTDFEGHFKIASKSKFSTPNDYNDTEKVVK